VGLALKSGKCINKLNHGRNTVGVGGIGTEQTKRWIVAFPKFANVYFTV